MRQMLKHARTKAHERQSVDLEASYFSVSITRADLIVTSLTGRSLRSVFTSPILRTTARLASSPAFPKAVYCRSRWVCFPRQMKNCEPAELGSLVRAIDTTPNSCGVVLNS